jgi:DNA (cytosine-5)-methyltransferase 1
MLNGLDLFSGIGGLALALHPWVRPVAYCEIDRYAQAVLLCRMADGALPRAPIWDDVRSLRADMLPCVDIISGGFPCQDLSVAGLGAGLAGERSGLFFEIARLTGEIRPSFIFLENVPAIRSRGADVVTGRLAELGYDCRWGVLSAFDVGAPHLRDRWWLLAHRNGDRCQVESQRDGEESKGGGSRQRDPDRLRDPLSDSFGQFLREQQGRWSGESRPGQAGPGDDVGRVVDGLPHRVDRLRALGNSVCPAAARAAFAGLAGLVDTGVPGWQINIPTNRPS